MVRVILGVPGAGKTKNLIDLIKKAAAAEIGNVVCIEKGSAMTFDIPYSVRLVQAADYAFGSDEFLRGFISGMHAGNYDITHIFIDGLLELLPNLSTGKLEEFLDWCERFSETQSVKFTITLSMPESSVTDGIRKFL